MKKDKQLSTKHYTGSWQRNCHMHMTSLKIPKGYSKTVNQSRQTIQWPKERRRTMIYKTLHRQLKIETRIPLKSGGESRYSGKVDSKLL